jgi:predicted nuclease of predicted toxin-antitoxin system
MRTSCTGQCASAARGSRRPSSTTLWPTARRRSRSFTSTRRCLPRDAEELLRRGGHVDETTRAEGLGGEPDSAILDACRRENRILISYDLDFTYTMAYPPTGHPGNWVLRPARQSIARTLTLLERALKLLATESPQQRL